MSKHSGNFLPIIGPRKGKFLAEEIRKAKLQHVLEVGTLIGYSTILMGKELDDKAEIVTIEIHQDEADLAFAFIDAKKSEYRSRYIRVGENEIETSAKL